MLALLPPGRLARVDALALLQACWAGIVVRSPSMERGINPIAIPMRSIGALAGTIVILLAGACDKPGAERPRAAGTPDTPLALGQGADPAHVLFGCMVGDSAVYSNVERDSAAGIRIMLWQAGDGVDGATEAALDPTHSVPVAGIRLVARDSVLIDISRSVNAPDTTHFVGRVACDSLWGRQEDSRKSPARDVTFRRLH